jgi:hypothetical protein
MLPEQKGRHCEACKTVVTDFTIMTDAEIINHLKATASNTCGRFLDTQLNRELIEPTKTYNWFSIPKLPAAASILFSLLQLPVFAQVKNEVRTEQTQIQKSDSTKQKLSGDIIIKGIILRANDYEPMDYVAVGVYLNNKIIAVEYTYENGSFSCKLSSEKYADSIVDIRIKNFGFKPDTLKNIVLDKNHIELGKLYLPKDSSLKIPITVNTVIMGKSVMAYSTTQNGATRKKATRIYIDGIETKPPSDSLYQSDSLQIKTDSSYNKNKIIVGGAIATRNYATIRQLTPWQRFKRKIGRLF